MPKSIGNPEPPLTEFPAGGFLTIHLCKYGSKNAAGLRVRCGYNFSDTGFFHLPTPKPLVLSLKAALHRLAWGCDAGISGSETPA